ncbi:MAG: glycosyltransferase family 2 protein [Thermoleophilaceae bacterium]
MTVLDRLAVAIVSFNTRALLESCLESVLAAHPAQTVVVDNGSTDGSIELVRDRFAGVQLLTSERNRGYGAAANAAIAACDAPAVLLLNADTLLEPQTLTALGRYLDEHPDAAVVGPRLVNADGTLQGSAHPFPSARDALLAESGLHLVVRRLPWLRERSWRTWSHDRARQVPWVLGAALAIRRGPFEAVGGFDEAFFMYGEEVDLCRRLASAGFEVHFAPVATVVHLGGGSTAAHAAAMEREYIVGQRRYLTRHESRPRARRVLLVMRAIVFARLLRDAARLRLARGSERRRLRAAVAGWRQMVRERELWRP